MDSTRILFTAVQVFENEIHYQSVRKNNDIFQQSVNTSDAFERIYDLLQGVSTTHYNTIYLYPDEYERVKDLFEQTVKYFEDLQEYEKCYDLTFSRNRIFFCIKIVT